MLKEQVAFKCGRWIHTFVETEDKVMNKYVVVSRFTVEVATEVEAASEKEAKEKVYDIDTDDLGKAIYVDDTFEIQSVERK